MALDDKSKESNFTDSTAPKAQPEDTSDVGLGGDGTPLNPKDPAGVQFIPASGRGGDPQNGDAKVEIGDAIAVTPFVGLGKEDLMKFANDPFWVRLRWILFILFWVLWVAMLAGAIVIIILAPKCKDPKSVTQQIVENGPFYQIYLKSFSPNGNLDGLKDKVSYIKDLGVKSVIISDVVDKTDFKKLDKNFGGDVSTLKNVVEEFNKNDVRVILQFIPNHSGKNNPWFSENREYYVTKSTEDVAKSTWKSVSNPTESAWTAIENTTLSYLHQFGADEPDFNYKNDGLVSAMNDVLKHWFKETGIDGFLLSDVSYLLENLNQLENVNATINQKGNKQILEKLLNDKEWEAGEERSPFALLDVTGLTGKQALEDYAGKKFTPIVTVELNPNFNAADLKSQFESKENQYVLRRLSSPRTQRFNEKYSKERANILTMVSYLAKGELVVYYGDEVGLEQSGAAQNPLEVSVEPMKFDSSVDSSKLNFYKELGKISKTNLKKSADEDVDIVVKNDTDILAFKRGDIIVVANLGNQEETVDVKEFLKIEGAGEYHKILPTPGQTFEEVSPGKFRLPGLSGVVLHHQKQDAPATTT